jgi:acetylornithine deacetylase/succinyl-diaminopimelate desuccinylase-like protein
MNVLSLLLAAGVSAAIRPALPPPAASAWVERNEPRIVAELADLLAIPNVASDTANIERDAAAVAALFRRRGLRVDLLRVEGAPPVVLAERDVAGARRTLTFYAHYDGQPVHPAEWHGSPWTPVLRSGRVEDPGSRPIPLDSLPARLDPDWRLYARSAGDDKAPIVGFAAALDFLRDSGIVPRANLRFFFEGEEEAGSPHLAEYLTRYEKRLRTDAWILCDGPVHQSGRPQVVFGARGTTDLEITVYGPIHGLHSGHYGNWAPNPITELTHLIDSMRDEDARILVPGFLDDVRPLSEDEKRALAAVPRVDEQLEREFAIGRTESGGIPLVEAIQRPAINVRGISGGHVGNLASNTIVPEATASIDFRLVPDQTPERVQRLVEAHVERQGYFIVHDEPGPAIRRSRPKVARLDWNLGYRAYRTPLDSPFGREVMAAVESAVSSPVVRMPMLGGSIPMDLFAGSAQTPVVIVPIANHDDNQHSADENLRLGNLFEGIQIYISLFARLGR